MCTKTSDISDRSLGCYTYVHVDTAYNFPHTKRV